VVLVLGVFGFPYQQELEGIMVRRVLWVVGEIALGLAMAGLLAPVAILIAPDRLRGSAMLWGLALVCVAVVATVRRVGLARLARRRR
jgi:hypothetical protein